VLHQLPATPQAIHWGYFDNSLPPTLTVSDGDLVALEALTHHAGDAPDLLMDPGIERIFDEVVDRGPGPHLLTGPIAVDTAEPGDVLEVRILDLVPRPGIEHGSNFAGHWGHLYRDFGKERVTIWSFDRSSGYGRPVFGFDWKTTPLADQPGTVVTPGSLAREPIVGDISVALRPHLGTMGVAPVASGRHSSVPPGDHGGNIDNWRAGPGTTMYYPVGVPGALLSAGDPHFGQGDGEVSGTALEASVDALLQLRVRRDLPIDVPTLETPTHWYVHGFGDDLDEAMDAAARRLLAFIQRMWGLTADDA
jgi:acetamidase/formamidase